MQLSFCLDLLKIGSLQLRFRLDLLIFREETLISVGNRAVQYQYFEKPELRRRADDRHRVSNCEDRYDELGRQHAPAGAA